ncbi:Tyrosine-protein phosphatase non-receptor type 18 [Pteropus alecto]|uniref:protein-tyrosine-phosphatase n=1 Tax=Pteropus alecto TaxID=9402 RepID=L5JWG2_PTEAL|nr:Tyrosine-protein phosphatase non-receptor type 18 [Pteropus alecto]
MSGSLDAARSILEQLEARGGREGAVLAGEFYKKRKHYWAQEQKPLQIGLFCITLMFPPNFSLFNVVEMRKQLPAVVQTEEQYRFLYHTVAQMFFLALQNASLHFQNLKEIPRPPSHYSIHQHPQIRTQSTGL